MARKHSQHIREFILSQLSETPSAISRKIVERFNVSRATAVHYLDCLAKEGYITKTGNTKASKYTLKLLQNEEFSVQLSHGLSENAIWQFRIVPLMSHVPKNILDICQHGFTEIFNNAIDHSASPSAVVIYQEDAQRITLKISDQGIGIFEKLKRDFSLLDTRSALLELSKGLLTSDKANHAGEGIFFTSRMFEEFSIQSGDLFYSRVRRTDDDWLIEESDESNFFQGTYVRMSISKKAKWTLREVFNAYQGDPLRFRRTHVPVKLARYPNEQLVSRSQAKRLLVRFDEFTEVMLDFEDIDFIGQAFADEVFRIFPAMHPDIQVKTMNTNADINRMIEHVKRNEVSQPELPLN